MKRPVNKRHLDKIEKYVYNGVKKHRKIITLFGCKFVSDND